MRQCRAGTVAAALVATLFSARRAAPAGAPSEPGSYARIAILHPRDGHTTDFEAGYVRHLAWHQQDSDPWSWYGWTVTFGERHLLARTTVEILTLRPTMSLGLPSPAASR